MNIKLFTYKTRQYQFAPTWLGFFITIICIPVFINFGLWQYGKAQTKKDMQEKYQQSNNNTALNFPVNILEADAEDKEKWEYKRVSVKGTYVKEYAFLLDNQVENTQAGYHVLTPLKIKDTSQFVLVNRGWIPGNAIHADVPKVETPTGVVDVEGQIWIPSTKFFTLEEKQIEENQVLKPVWQNVDMAEYKKQVPFEVSALLIKLDPKSKAGGFVRNWQVPVKRIATHLGYAFQWFGFAFATLIIFLYLSVKQVAVRNDKE
jgi:surfeit locus 1 family protein